LASVNDTVAVFVITVPSGVGDCACSVGIAASVRINAMPATPADRKRVHIIGGSFIV
jgi:hypothetical protein